MSIYSATINEVKDKLQTAVDSGNLAWFKQLYFGEQDQVITYSKPSLLLRLDNPFITPPEEWAALKDKRQNFFHVVVVVISGPTDKDFPYGKPGDATKRGLLTDVEAVMNELDDERAAFLAASPRNIDMQLSGRETSNIGNRTFEAEVVLSFRQRFTLGGR